MVTCTGYILLFFIFGFNMHAGGHFSYYLLIIDIYTQITK